MDKVRLGFVGCGMMGQLVHLPNFLELQQCEVVALAELRPLLGEQVAKRYGIPKLYRSHAELAEDPGVDAVVQITAEDFHAPVTIDLLKAGKHVMIEKPLTTNVTDGEEMVKAAELNNAVLMVSFMRRYDPGVELAKQYIDELRESKEIGAIELVHCHRFGNDWFRNLGEPITTDEPYPAVSKTAPAWLPQEMVDRFRVFNSAYCHNVDLLRHLLGEVKDVEFANIGPRGKVVVLGFDGFPATIEAGSNPAPFWNERITVYFSNGWVDMKLPPPLLRNVSAEVEIYRAGKRQEVRSPRAPWEWSFYNADRNFLECVINEQEPRSSARSALESLKVIEAIFAKYLESSEGNSS